MSSTPGAARPRPIVLRVLSESEVITKLTTAGANWSTVRGRTRWWRRDDLVVQAFTAHFDQIAESGGHVWTLTASRDLTADDALDDVIETALAVAVQRVPWKLRVDLVSAHGDESRTDVLVVDGNTCWWRSGSETFTNGGDPHTSNGGGRITHLLDPETVPQLFDLSVDGETRAAGRACTTVTATRRPSSDGGWPTWPEPPFAMITGGNLFRLSVDNELGVLLRVVKVVDGLDAEITEFTEVTIDDDLPGNLFAPLPHARV